MSFLFAVFLFLSFVFTHGMKNGNKTEIEKSIKRFTTDTDVELQKDIVWTGWICHGPNWERRWFLLHENGNFEYYDNDENTEKKLKGQGNILMGYTNVTKQRFRIATFYAQQNWIFQFTNDTDMEFWIKFCNQTSRFSTLISAVNKRFNDPLSRTKTHIEMSSPARDKRNAKRNNQWIIKSFIKSYHNNDSNTDHDVY